MHNTFDHQWDAGATVQFRGDLEEALTWVAGMLRKGLTQVYAVQASECFEPKRHARLVEHCQQRTRDAAVAGRLEVTLQALAQADAAARAALVERVAPIVFEGIDRILEQAQAAGHDRGGVHLAAARFGLEVVILVDRGPQYAWLLSTAQARLREVFAELGVYPTIAATQEVDLAQGETLQLLGYDFRAAQDRHGHWKVHYQPMQPSANWHATPESAIQTEAPAIGNPSISAGAGRVPQAKPSQSRAAVAVDKEREDEGGPVDQDIGARSREAQSTTEPQPASEPHSRRWPGRTAVERSAQLVGDLLQQAGSIEVGWRHAPITLYPVLGILAGWNSPLAWLCLALILAGNWRSLPTLAGLAWRDRLNAALAVCLIAALLLLWTALNELYATMSREAPAPHWPPGFYLSQYNVSWDRESVRYGLYLPPHFREQKGPFPLIVFLNFRGSETNEHPWSQGIAMSIQSCFGEHTINGPFPFAVFWPTKPVNGWQPQTEEVEDALQALDYVIRRHRIDPARVYLTGMSGGANGAWRWAQAYPDRWAAVVPVAADIEPEVLKVRHIPTWIFQGAKDRPASVQLQRALVQRLKDARADVRYTEFPGRGHAVWETYDRKELYEWLATKVRP